MKKCFVLFLSAFVAVAVSLPTLAEVGITDNCQQEVKELEDKIDKN